MATKKWDYLYSDDASGKLYVSHGSQVQVVDEEKGEVIGKITGLFGVHGIAIVSDLNKGFISNGKDNSVTIFDAKTFEVITKIPVTGTNPDCIMYDPSSKNIFTMNGKSNNTTVINAETNKVIATIKLNGKPEFAVSNGKGLVYVNYEEENKNRCHKHYNPKGRDNLVNCTGRRSFRFIFRQKKTTVYSVFVPTR